MKTVIIWDTCTAEIRFIVIDGDYRHLNDTYLGGNDAPEKEEELEKLLFTENGGYKYQLSNKFPTGEVVHGAFVIVAGNL